MAGNKTDDRQEVIEKLRKAIAKIEQGESLPSPQKTKRQETFSECRRIINAVAKEHGLTVLFGHPSEFARLRKGKAIRLTLYYRTDSNILTVRVDPGSDPCAALPVMRDLYERSGRVNFFCSQFYFIERQCTGRSSEPRREGRRFVERRENQPGEDDGIPPWEDDNSLPWED